jgi:ABC-2 type transport system ATP-binding protein
LAAREPLTIFDEPVLGLDVLVREKFYKLLMEEYANHPRTFVIATHLIDEISNIVEKVYIIDEGQLLLGDDMENIQSKAYYISGNQAVVEEFVGNKQVIHRERIGHSTLVSIFDTLDEDERREAARLDLAIEGMPFQKFFAYFVEGREKGE